MKRKVMSEQGLFNFVWRFMEKQGAPSVAQINGKQRCTYRAVDVTGVKACAAGCLLSDAEAAAIPASHQDDSWCVMERFIPARLRPFSDLIQQLQDCHDGAADDVTYYHDVGFLGSFSKRMRKLAKERGLAASPANPRTNSVDTPG